MILQITQVGLIILIPPSKESKLDFLINHLLPQDKTSLDSPLVISFSTFILSNRCVSLGCSKDWKNWSVKSYHFPWFVTSMTCPYVWQYENWKIGPNWGPSWIAQTCQMPAEIALRMTSRKARTESEASEEISALRLSAGAWACVCNPSQWPLYNQTAAQPQVWSRALSVNSDIRWHTTRDCSLYLIQ